jgi:hypothetical protein
VTGVPPEYLFGMMYKALVVEAESEGTRRLLDVGEDTDTHKHVMTKKTLGNLYAELWPGTREKKNPSAIALLAFRRKFFPHIRCIAASLFEYFRVTTPAFA